MSDKQAEVKGHEWIYWAHRPDLGYCNCGNLGHPMAYVTSEQHAAQVSVLASQVPAQPPAPRNCICGHGFESHLGAIPGCRELRCRCKAYEPAAPVPAQPPAQPQVCGLICVHVDEYCALPKGHPGPHLPAAPASPQVGEGLEQEVDDLMTELGAWDSEPCYQRATKAVTAFVREKLRAALLVSGDKKVTLLNEDTLLAQEYEYTQPGEAPITANVGGWYSSAVYWRHQTIRLRAALAESEARIAALAERWEKEATGGRKKAIAAARLSGEPLQHFIEYEEALERCAKELRALAAQPTPAPKERR